MLGAWVHKWISQPSDFFCVLQFPTTSQKLADRSISDCMLPLDVNKCVNVCVCMRMVPWLPNQRIQRSQDRFQIHCDPNQDPKEITEDERMMITSHVPKEKEEKKYKRPKNHKEKLKQTRKA